MSMQSILGLLVGFLAFVAFSWCSYCNITAPIRALSVRPKSEKGSTATQLSTDRINDVYFSSYSGVGIHESMLGDEVRTSTYQKAIMDNADMFKDKVVLDVGCGTAILSMFAAKAGAKLVLCVDMSDMIKNARMIVEQNGLSDRVKVIQGKMEEVRLPVDKVDIIISEWMGYFLLFESMLDTVLWARDRYLVEGGKLFPETGAMYLAAIEDENYKPQRIYQWDNVYGFDMGVLKDITLRDPVIDTVEQEKIATDTAVIKQFDFRTMRKEDVIFTSRFKLTATQQKVVHGITVWFDVVFPGDIRLTTSPYEPATHWRQSTIYLPRDMSLEVGDEIEGEIRLSPNVQNPRALDIKVRYELKGADEGPIEQQYALLMIV